MFKAWADAASPPKLIPYLFSKDCLHQSLRLGLANAWAQRNPALAASVQELREVCPQLITSFLPPHERLKATENSPAVIQRTTYTHSIHLWQRVPLSQQPFYIPQLSSRTTDNDDEFIAQLRSAYATGYSMHHIVDFGTKRIQVKQSASFTR